MKDRTCSLVSRKIPSSTLAAFLFSCFAVIGSPFIANAQDTLRLPTGVAPGVKVMSPDLAVSNFANIPSSAAPGSALVLTVVTRNLGTVITQAPCITKCYLSTDLAVGNDIYLGQWTVASGLAPGAASPGSGSLIVPANTPPGAYYVLACADAGRAFSEFNKGNNCLTSPTKILIGKPDLQVTSVAPSRSRVGAGATFQITDAIKNIGVSATVAQTLTRYYLSTDQTLGNDYSIGERIVMSGLAGGSSNTGTQNVVVPAQVPDGNYYIIAAADAGAAVAEANESNNILVGSQVIVAPLDVGIQSVTFTPTETKAGYKISVTDTTVTLGSSLPTQRVSWTAIVLSADKVKNAGDWHIGYREVPPGVKSNSMMNSFTIPRHHPSGHLLYTWLCGFRERHAGRQRRQQLYLRRLHTEGHGKPPRPRGGFLPPPACNRRPGRRDHAQ